MQIIYTGERLFPSSVKKSDGTFLNVWVDSKGIKVQIQVSDVHGNVGSVVDVGEMTSTKKYNPVVTTLENEDIVVVWHEELRDGSGFGVYGHLLDKDLKSKGKEFRINTDIQYNQDHPSLASLEGNKFIVTWQHQEDKYNYVIKAQLFEEGDKVVKRVFDEFRVDIGSIDKNQERPDVSYLGDQKFAITWYGYDLDLKLKVFVQNFRYTDTEVSAIGEKSIVSTCNIEGFRVFPMSGFPSIALLEDRFIITYQSNCQEDMKSAVYGQMYYKNGTKLNGNFKISDQEEGNQQNSRVMALDNESYVVIWKSVNTGAIYKVYSQEYYNNGTRINNNTLVSNEPIKGLSLVELVSLGNSSYGVMWSSYNPYLLQKNVYCQIMGPVGIMYSANITNSTNTTIPVTTDLETVLATEAVIPSTNEVEGTTNDPAIGEKSTQGVTVKQEEQKTTQVPTVAPVTVIENGGTETETQNTQTTNPYTQDPKFSTLPVEQTSSVSSITDQLQQTQLLTGAVLTAATGAPVSGADIYPVTTEAITTGEKQTTVAPQQATYEQQPTEVTTQEPSTKVLTNAQTSAGGLTTSSPVITQLPVKVVSITNGTYTYVVGTNVSEEFVVDPSVKYVNIQVGEGASDTVVVSQSNNSLIEIVDFKTGDTIDLTNFTSITSYENLNITSGSTHIHLPHNQTLVIQNKFPEEISERNFKFYQGLDPDGRALGEVGSGGASEEQTQSSENGNWWPYVVGSVGALCAIGGIVGSFVIYKHVHNNNNRVVPFDDAIGDTTGEFYNSPTGIPVGEGVYFTDEN